MPTWMKPFVQRQLSFKSIDRGKAFPRCVVASLREIFYFSQLLRASQRYDATFYIAGNYRSNNSQGFSPVCFLNAVEKCEMEE